MADIDNKTRKFAANNPQVTLQEGMEISVNSQNCLQEHVTFLQFAKLKFRFSSKLNK